MLREPTREQIETAIAKAAGELADVRALRVVRADGEGPAEREGTLVQAMGLLAGILRDCYGRE